MKLIENKYWEEMFNINLDDVSIRNKNISHIVRNQKEGELLYDYNLYQ